ncbi:MAG: ABC transporter permease [Bacillota bacterium]|nr:MAG: ABC transporter permease [Bacillota bacterium]
MTTLVYLGLMNSTRNIGRSLLTVIAMALAAFMMTASLTVGEGYTAVRAAEYRAYLGGDVLVYPTWAWPTEYDVVSIEEGDVRLAVMPEHFGSPLRYFHPDYWAGGYLTVAPGGAPTYSMFSDRAHMDRTVSAVESVRGVAGTVPYTAIPVMKGSLGFEGLGAGPATQVPLDGYFLRACPPNLLADAPAGTPPELRLVEDARSINPPRTVSVVASAGETLFDKKTWKSGVVHSGGRPLSSAEGDELVAVVNRRAVTARRDIGGPGVYLPPGGQTVTLTLPRIVPAGDGAFIYDFSDPVVVDLRVVGTYDVSSRLLNWMPARGMTVYEQLFLEAPELLLTEEAIDRLLALMGLPPGELPPVGALAVSLTDQSKAEEMTSALRTAVPGLSVVSVAAEASFANARNLPERSYECPFENMPAPRPLRQPAVPAEAGNILGFVLFGFAGLAAAGNSTLLVLSRRTEFAILKAIGMRAYEVALVVMVEVVTLAVIGLAVGFALGEITALPVILTNSVGTITVLRALAGDFGIVAGATLGCSILFSLVPMSKTLSITVAEAMRGNE